MISVTSNGENARVTNRPNEVQQDASFSLRADHCLIAFADGQLAARVLYGESTMQIPVGNVVPEQLALHYQTLPIYSGKGKLGRGLKEKVAMAIERDGKL